MNRAVQIFGSRPVAAITAQDVAEMIADLHEQGLKPSYPRKIAQATAMVFDHPRVTPNPAMDKQTVRLPHDRKPELVPPKLWECLVDERVEAVDRAPPRGPRQSLRRHGVPLEQEYTRGSPTAMPVR